MDDQEKQLDHWLDSLLANYADAEPRPGFETRLLAALREPQSAFRLGWLWAGAAAMVMAVAVSAVYYARLAELPPAPEIQVAGPPSPPPPIKVDGPGTKSYRPKSRVEIPPLVAHVDVRPEVFPTPAPLSEQERLLLRYLAGTPRDEVVSRAHEDELADGIDLFKPQTQRMNGAEVYSSQ